MSLFAWQRSSDRAIKKLRLSHVGSWKSGKRLPQITLASRLPPATRSFLNEGDLIPFIQAHWEVEVVSTGFTGSLYETMELMAHTDVFLGMHGEIDLAEDSHVL